MQTSLKDINKVFPRTKTLLLHGSISLLLAMLLGKYVDNEIGGCLLIYSICTFFILIVRHFVIYVRLRADYESQSKNGSKGGK
mgnify:FL=1|jgi:hypothetical protein|nr:MAG TPA: hypothetical protein [Caudoviricetes sp.]